MRAFRFLDYLTREHDVELLTFDAWPGRRPQRSAQAELRAALQARCRETTWVPLPGGGAWRNCLCNAISEEPFQVAYHRSAAMRRAVAERLGAGRPELVWVNGLAMAQYAGGLPVPAILDAGGCSSHHYHRLSLLPQPLPRRAFYRGEAARARLYEARVLPGFARCLVSSARDRERLWQLAPRAAIQVIPDTIELTRLPALRPQSAAGTADDRCLPPRIAFTGDLHCAAHRDAAFYLCRRVLPRIRRVLPRAEAMIIGPGQQRLLRALAHLPGVGVTGPVLDVRGPLAHAAAAAYPLRAENGFPAPVVEAMACGKPVIVSPLVMDSLGLRTNDPLLTAESAAEFAAHAVALLQQPRAAERLGGRGRQLVLERFNIHTVAERLNEILAHLAPPRSSRQAAAR